MDHFPETNPLDSTPDYQAPLTDSEILLKRKELIEGLFDLASTLRNLVVTSSYSRELPDEKMFTVVRVDDSGKKSIKFSVEDFDTKPVQGYECEINDDGSFSQTAYDESLYEADSDEHLGEGYSCLEKLKELVVEKNLPGETKAFSKSQIEELLKLFETDQAQLHLPTTSYFSERYTIGEDVVNIEFEGVMPDQGNKADEQEPDIYLNVYSRNKFSFSLNIRPDPEESIVEQFNGQAIEVEQLHDVLEFIKAAVEQEHMRAEMDSAEQKYKLFELMKELPNAFSPTLSESELEIYGRIRLLQESKSISDTEKTALVSEVLAKIGAHEPMIELINRLFPGQDVLPEKYDELTVNWLIAELTKDLGREVNIFAPLITISKRFDCGFSKIAVGFTKMLAEGKANFGMTSVEVYELYHIDANDHSEAV